MDISASTAAGQTPGSVQDTGRVPDPSRVRFGNPAAEIVGVSTSEPSFEQLVQSLLADTEVQQDQIGQEVQNILTGQTSSMHEVSMAVANADLSFRFLMQVRDQLIQTYREVIRMQV